METNSKAFPDWGQDPKVVAINQSIVSFEAKEREQRRALLEAVQAADAAAAESDRASRAYAIGRGGVAPMVQAQTRGEVLREERERVQAEVIVGARTLTEAYEERERIEREVRPRVLAELSAIRDGLLAQMETVKGISELVRVNEEIRRVERHLEAQFPGDLPAPGHYAMRLRGGLNLHAFPDLIESKLTRWRDWLEKAGPKAVEKAQAAERRRRAAEVAVAARELREWAEGAPHLVA